MVSLQMQPFPSTTISGQARVFPCCAFSTALRCSLCDPRLGCRQSEHLEHKWRQKDGLPRQDYSSRHLVKLCWRAVTTNGTCSLLVPFPVPSTYASILIILRFYTCLLSCLLHLLILILCVLTFSLSLSPLTSLLFLERRRN